MNTNKELSLHYHVFLIAEDAGAKEIIDRCNALGYNETIAWLKKEFVDCLNRSEILEYFEAQDVGSLMCEEHMWKEHWDEDYVLFCTDNKIIFAGREIT